jgi:hypothetical protein
MKHLQLFEDYSKEDISKMLLKAQKKSQLELKVGVDDILSNLKEPIPMFGFEAIVEEEARFLSESDYKKMGEYIQKFKELGLNTSKIEKLYPKLQKYKHIQFKDADYATTNWERNLAYDKLDKLQPFVDQLVEEVKRLAKEAKKLLDDN